MSTTNENKILDVLKTVIDPDLGRNIVELGFVKNLTATDSEVSFELELTTPACPLKARFKEECEDKIKALGISNVNIILTSKTRSTLPENTIKGVKNIIAVASGKGGVGKSTVAVNLAIALKRMGAKVGLFDADIYGPSIPTMLGVHSRPVVDNDNKIVPVERFDLKLISIGFFIEEGVSVIWRGPMVHRAVKQFLEEVNWGELDYLVVDLPPGTGDVQLTMVQSVNLSGAVIVTTPQDVALIDARRGLEMFKKVGVPVFGIVENMSWFECPNCHEHTRIFGSGGGESVSKELDVPFLGELPLIPEIRETCDNGEPIVESRPESLASKRFNEIAQRVVSSISILEMEREENVINNKILKEG